MNTKKQQLQQIIAALIFPEKQAKIAKQRLSAMQHSDKKEFRTAFTNKSD